MSDFVGSFSIAEIAATQRLDGVIADAYEYDLQVCANITALSLAALISQNKNISNDEKYEQAIDDEFVNKSVDYLLKFLAEDGEFSHQIRLCFKYLLDNFAVSGERANMMRKILENGENIDNIDVSALVADLKNKTAYEYLHMVTMLT